MDRFPYIRIHTTEVFAISKKYLESRKNDNIMYFINQKNNVYIFIPSSFFFLANIPVY